MSLHDRMKRAANRKIGIKCRPVALSVSSWIQEVKGYFLHEFGYQSGEERVQIWAPVFVSRKNLFVALFLLLHSAPAILLPANFIMRKM
jgi:hypothetical protein